MKQVDKIKYCNNCGADLSLTDTTQNSIPDMYGVQAVKWFEKGLKDGYFEINGQKIWSVMFFHIFCKLFYLLDKKQDLYLSGFPMLDKYKQVCKKLETYNSKKANAIYKSFYVNSMIYHLFQNFPFNLLDFIESNHLTYREFTHGLKHKPFWYENMLSELIPKQNKIGREISEEEVLGAIRYLKKEGRIVNQLNVAELLGCHFTIHKGFVNLYKIVKLINL